MAVILKERVVNRNKQAWIRTHATDTELSALCSYEIHSELETVEEGMGQITCPDCIAIVMRCQEIDKSDLAPEYDNEFLTKKWDC